MRIFLLIFFIENEQKKMHNSTEYKDVGTQTTNISTEKYVLLPREIFYALTPKSQEKYIDYLYSSFNELGKCFEQERDRCNHKGHGKKVWDIRTRCKVCCEEIAKHYPSVWQRVPDEFKTPKLCKIAVETCEHNIRHVPLEMKAKQICLWAVRHNGKLLKYVPLDKRDRVICLTAVENHYRITGI